MRVIKSFIKGVLIFELDVFKDSRGRFFETYQKRKYKELGLISNFVQENISISKKNVLRGIHFQKKKPIGQLIYVTRGKIFDVGVDLRRNSKTFGKHISIILSENDNKQIYLPAGIAHGFCAMENYNQIHYKCDQYYYPEDENGLSWRDPKLKIKWPIKKPIINKRDKNFTNLDNFKIKDFPSITK